MLYLTIAVLLSSPIPTWAPKLAIAIAIVVAVAVVGFISAIVIFAFGAASKLLRGKELSPALMRVRDAGHPVRKHQHMHYSAKLSEELHPLTETEYEDLGIDEDFHH